jgi:hypothetical protein
MLRAFFFPETVKIQSNARKIQFCLVHMRACACVLQQQYNPFVSAMKEVQNTEKKEFGKHATYLRRLILQRVEYQ